MPHVHFLLQVAITLVLLVALMTGITLSAPLPAPRVIPANPDVDVRSSTGAKLAGADGPVLTGRRQWLSV